MVRAVHKWSWAGSQRWHCSVIGLLRERRGQALDMLQVAKLTRRGRAELLDSGSISAASVRRVLRDFVAGQCGALAVDLGDDSRNAVILAERLCSHLREATHILTGTRRVGVRRARAAALCTLVAMHDDPVQRTLLVMRLRSRRTREIPPHRVLEAFFRAEAGIK